MEQIEDLIERLINRDEDGENYLSLFMLLSDLNEAMAILNRNVSVDLSYITDEENLVYYDDLSAIGKERTKSYMAFVLTNMGIDFNFNDEEDDYDYIEIINADSTVVRIPLANMVVAENVHVASNMEDVVYHFELDENTKQEFVDLVTVAFENINVTVNSSSRNGLRIANETGFEISIDYEKETILDEALPEEESLESEELYEEVEEEYSPTYIPMLDTENITVINGEQAHIEDEYDLIYEEEIEETSTFVDSITSQLNLKFTSKVEAERLEKLGISLGEVFVSEEIKSLLEIDAREIEQGLDEKIYEDASDIVEKDEEIVEAVNASDFLRININSDISALNLSFVVRDFDLLEQFKLDEDSKDEKILEEEDGDTEIETIEKVVEEVTEVETVEEVAEAIVEVEIMEEITDVEAEVEIVEEILEELTEVETENTSNNAVVEESKVNGDMMNNPESSSFLDGLLQKYFRALDDESRRLIVLYVDQHASDSEHSSLGVAYSNMRMACEAMGFTVDMDLTNMFNGEVSIEVLDDGEPYYLNLNEEQQREFRFFVDRAAQNVGLSTLFTSDSLVLFNLENGFELEINFSQ